MQVGVLHGGFEECGNDLFPNIYARLEDPEILHFVQSKIGSPTFDLPSSAGISSLPGSSGLNLTGHSGLKVP